MSLRRPRRFPLPALAVACALIVGLAGAAPAGAATSHAGAKTSATAKKRAAAKRHAAAKKRAAARRRAARRTEAIAAGSGLQIGLVANTQGMGAMWAIGREQDRVAATGARWIREEFVWSKIEPRQGTFDFAHYDDVMTAASRRGLRVLPQFDGTPSWAGRSWNTVPRDPSEFARYVGRVVARYGPSGSFWAAHPEWASLAPQWFEVWNEAYYAPGGADEYDPARYARLVRAAAQAGRAADPAARFLLGAEATGRKIGSRWVSWIDELYDAAPDLNAWFDGVAVHPYGADLTGLDGIGNDQFRRLEVLRKAFVEHGAADKPFWATELGWATCARDAQCVSEARQAAALRTAITAMRTTYASFVRAVFLYHLSDWGPADQSNKEYWFGLDRRNGSHKPAWQALRELTGATS